MARITGRAIDDILPGTTGSDVIRGLAGNDTIRGNGGNDDIDGGDGNDVITAGNGRDSIDGGIGDDRITAGGGDDEIFGGDGADTLFGGAGNDIIYGDLGPNNTTETGDDLIDGGAGDDILLGDLGNDIIIGGVGSDFISGGAGDDTLFSHGWVDSSSAPERDEFYGGLGADQFNLLSNYAGSSSVKSLQPKRSPNDTTPGRDNSFAIIQDLNFDQGDSLNLLDENTSYIVDISQNFFGLAVADTLITQNGNVVAVVVDRTLSQADLGSIV